MFARYPVRRKILLKESGKNIVKIRHLILSFALVYPHIRFELRIKSSSQKPLVFNSTTELKEKLAQVFTVKKLLNLEESKNQLFKNWTWTTILPKLLISKSENNKVPGNFKEKLKWEFCLFAVNGRPLNPILPFTRKIIASINSRLSSIIFDNESSNDVSLINPMWMISISFMHFHDFDINIEPSKDDILFSNLSQVLGIIDDFLNHHYHYTSVNKKTITPNDNCTSPVYNKSIVKKVEKYDNISCLSQSQTESSQKKSPSIALKRNNIFSAGSKTPKSPSDESSVLDTSYTSPSIHFTPINTHPQTHRLPLSSPSSSPSRLFTDPNYFVSSPMHTLPLQVNQKVTASKLKKKSAAQPGSSIPGVQKLISQYISTSNGLIPASLNKQKKQRACHSKVMQKKSISQVSPHNKTSTQPLLSLPLTPLKPISLSQSPTAGRFKKQSTIPSFFGKVSRSVRYVHDKFDAEWITTESICAYYKSSRRSFVTADFDYSIGSNLDHEKSFVPDFILLLTRRLVNECHEYNPRLGPDGWMILE